MQRDEIIRQALDLGQNIGRSQEWERMQRAQNEVQRDETALGMVMDFQRHRSQLLAKQEAGQVITEEERQALANANAALRANPLVGEMIAAQESFENLMRAVHFSLNQGISGAGACSSGCDGCGGGCS
ncbi:MAG: YlbF family regulator [Syntrophomonadaceae bacterium]|jgi:cell fate (sporulation/competence/biofilm development) regulator YlbF (YheA/YmcA/DUF963 family)|nr:YlbF family regulator [Syntrophomonadaceae bacterium]MDH7497424.1 YlbF family regulator [Syntrophomonadaceae bacterium]